MVVSMNREDVIQMAQKAGFVWLGEYHSNLEDFAKLVAQHEREACAKIGDDHPSWSSRMYSATIRARGQA
jgi:hypothetical protein